MITRRGLITGALAMMLAPRDLPRKVWALGGLPLSDDALITADLFQPSLRLSTAEHATFWQSGGGVAYWERCLTEQELTVIDQMGPLAVSRGLVGYAPLYHATGVVDA